MKAKLTNFVALDLGSSKIAGIAAYIDNNAEARILSQNIHYSEGIKSGIITDLKLAENSIIGSIFGLEKDCGKNIRQVSISLSGLGTKSYYVYHKIKVSSSQVSKQDIKTLIHKALSSFKIKDQEIIHYFPIEYSLDANNSIQDPTGMVGKELGCRIHIVTADSNLLMNLTNCLAKCQLEIGSVVLASYASGLACLTEDEKNLGSVLIDMGAKSTNFAIFLSGKLIYSGYVPLGSFHITSDIAKVLSISFGAAEKLKVLYGNALDSNFERENLINLDELEPDNIFNSSISSEHLSKIIHPRIKEILELLKSEYDKVGIDHLIARRVVITGGGSMLRGAKELASQIFEKHVRVGKPNIIPGFAEDYNPSIYSTSVGMVKYQSLKQLKASSEFVTDHQNTPLLKKILMWLKENI